jgi:SAM-dependent methyltransferase
VPFAVITAICLVGVTLSFVSPWFLLFAVPLVPAGYIFTILALSAYRLSPRGADLQHRFHELIVTTLDSAAGSTALDIGCGSGHLAITLAKSSPSTAVSGLDSGGPAWASSQEQCENNARLEGVDDRVCFRRGSAASLPFADDTFDAIVSCMTFHEVRDADPRSRAVIDALRVLRPGGQFVFVDPFTDRTYYPSLDDLSNDIQSAGATILQSSRLAALLPLSFPLTHPKVLGRVMLLVGTKSAPTAT